jgi:hypothetical protein
MENKQYKKLSEVPEFKVLKVNEPHFQLWNEAERKFTKDRAWFRGASKTWDIECEDFKLSLSSAQFKSMLEACFFVLKGISEPTGKRFVVKTNGEQGKDIRYFINLSPDQSETVNEVLAKADGGVELRETKVTPLAEKAMEAPLPEETDNIPF